MDPIANEPIEQLSPERRAKFYTELNSEKQQLSSKSSKKFDKKTILYSFLGLVVAALIIGAFLFVVTRETGGQIISPFSNSVFDSTGDKTVMNPITGEMFSESESSEWKGNRPLAVMVNNHTDARMQSGLSKADLVYEIVAEGGITRYMAFFLSSDPEVVGPIRSTREYYLVLVKELGDAMIMHIGWSPQALEAIQTWPVRSLDRGGAGSLVWRDQGRLDSGIAWEHTAYANAKELRELGNSLGWEGKREVTAWKFEDESDTKSVDMCLIGEASCDNPRIEIDFWYEGDYSGIFEYDRETNSYLRFVGYDGDGNPIPQIDTLINQQVKVKNVIIQFAVESGIEGDDKSRLEYDLTGSGTALVFKDGAVKEATWSKEGRDDRTMFYDTNGEEMLFNRGKFWISIVPERNQEQVTY